MDQFQLGLMASPKLAEPLVHEGLALRCVGHLYPSLVDGDCLARLLHPENGQGTRQPNVAKVEDGEGRRQQPVRGGQQGVLYFDNLVRRQVRKSSDGHETSLHCDTDSGTALANQPVRHGGCQ